MDKITLREWEELAEAVVVWTGFGTALYPSRDKGEEALVRRFGRIRASELLPAIRELNADFYASDAWQVAADLDEMDEMATKQFKEMYPEAPENAVRALAWCYTYDYK